MQGHFHEIKTDSEWIQISDCTEKPQEPSAVLDIKRILAGSWEYQGTARVWYDFRRETWNDLGSTLMFSPFGMVASKYMSQRVIQMAIRLSKKPLDIYYKLDREMFLDQAEKFLQARVAYARQGNKEAETACVDLSKKCKAFSDLLFTLDFTAYKWLSAKSDLEASVEHWNRAAIETYVKGMDDSG